jgi:ferredoxin
VGDEEPPLRRPRRKLEAEDFRTLGILVGGIRKNKVLRLMDAPKVENIMKLVQELDLDSLTVHQRYCTNNRLGRSICTRCIDGCPTDAISFEADVGLRVDQGACIRCGVCGPACPNAVFDPKTPSDAMIFETIERLLSGSEQSVLSVRCDGVGGRYEPKSTDKKAGGTLVVPCLGRMPEMAWLRAGQLGASQITFSECDKECPYTTGHGVFVRTRKVADHVLDALGKDVTVTSEADKAPKKTKAKIDDGNTKEGIDRRAFFSKIGRVATRTAEPPTKKPKEEVPTWHQRVPSGRRMLKEMAETSMVDAHPLMAQEDMPFADVDIDSVRCDFCGVCSVLCPTGALTSIELDDIGGVCFSFWKCTNCSLCRAVCPEDAIQIKRDTDLANLGDVARVLVKVNMEECGSCGVTYVGGQGKGICPNCDKRASIEAGLVDGFYDR